MITTKKKLSLLSAGLALCSLIHVAAGQDAQPVRCDVISLKYVSLGLDMAPVISGAPRKPGEAIGYEVTLNRSGDSKLHRNGSGFRNLPKEGHDFVGQADIIEFDKLCQIAKDAKFESLTSSYGPPSNVRVVDGSEMSVAISANNVTKTIYAESSYAPEELLAFQKTVVALVERIGWKAK